eukprot:5375553-Prorocentrum_lima.AAC.1
MRPPSFGIGSHSDVDSLPVRKKLPVLYFGSLSLAKIRKVFEHWITAMTLKISTWGEQGRPCWID